MTKEQALTLALEALEQWNTPMYKRGTVITAIKEALAQPEQEPVGFAVMERPWVGLTEAENAICLGFNKVLGLQYQEAKLKEKNT